MLQIHRWCGLAVALVFLVQAVTGCVLLYRDSLTQIFDPSGMVRHTRAGMVPVAQVVAALQMHDPGFAVTRINTPVFPDSTYFATLESVSGGVRYASIDPGSAEVLREGSVWRFPVQAALMIHYQVMAGDRGLLFVALEGIALLAMAATGLIYWWPKRGRWKGALAVRWSLSPRLVLRQLHRTTAVVLSAVLLLSASTGIVLSLALFGDAGPTASRLPDTGLDRIDAGIARARLAFPGQAIRDIRLPGSDRMVVHFYAPGINPEANDVARVDLSNAHVVAKALAARNNDLETTFMPIHTGEYLGAVGAALLLLGGLGLGALAISGPIMWLQRPRPARARRPASGLAP